MKRTEYVTMVGFGMSSGPKFRTVYTDGTDLYIRARGGYVKMNATLKSYMCEKKYIR